MLREFIMKGLLDAIGKMPEYWVRLNAGGWARDGVLTQQDLEEIDAKYEEPIEEPVEEVENEVIE